MLPYPTQSYTTLPFLSYPILPYPNYIIALGKSIEQKVISVTLKEDAIDLIELRREALK